jgi:hypothetical protein
MHHNQGGVWPVLKETYSNVAHVSFLMSSFCGRHLFELRRGSVPIRKHWYACVYCSNAESVGLSPPADCLLGHDWSCLPVPATSKVELHEVKESHMACPVPLFDLDGRLLLPGCANMLLPDATVFVCFTLVASVTCLDVMCDYSGFAWLHCTAALKLYLYLPVFHLIYLAQFCGCQFLPLGRGSTDSSAFLVT